jgi:membrane protein insertase Oxa1/YidC/SpoIIIJ
VDGKRDSTVIMATFWQVLLLLLILGFLIYAASGEAGVKILAGLLLLLLLFLVYVGVRAVIVARKLKKLKGGIKEIDTGM